MTNEQTLNPEASGFKKFLESFPFIHALFVVVFAVVSTYFTVQLTQANQAAEIRRNSEKIEKLEKDTVSRELFDERTKTIIDGQNKQSEKLDRILERK